jgi:hypothetical protein
MRNTEKTFGRIMTVVAFALASLMVYKCDAQIVSRMEYIDNGKKIVNKYKTESLELKTPLQFGDDIYLSVMSDSIDAVTITFRIFMTYPKGINPKGNDIVITYKDGTIDIFKQTRLDKDGYVEYEPSFGINNIAAKPVKSILIRGVAQYDVDKNYFIDFFANL